MENITEVCQKLTVDQANDPAIPVLSMYPEKMKSLS